MNISNKLKTQQPVKFAAFAMNERMQKMLGMFLKGPCRGAAIIVEDADADVDIIDFDSVNARQFVEQRQAMNPDRPIITLSLTEVSMAGVVFLKKPIQIQAMLNTIAAIRKDLISKHKFKDRQQQEIERLKAITSGQKAQKKPLDKVVSQPVSKLIDDPNKKKILDYEERKKTSKHKTAMLLDEKTFSAFIGVLTDIDFNDRKQLVNACYNRADYFQGYVQSAYNLSLAKGRLIKMKTTWKEISIFPHSQEIWIDANDTQIRSFSGVPMATFASGRGSNVSITPIDAKDKLEKVDLEKFQTMDAFLWKVAIWTSKGRYPQGINLDQPVYLKQWPNFTRLVVTPHALRMSALLIEGPRTLVNIAETLNIKYQYVFIYFSAIYALGIAGQAQRGADVMVAPREVKVNKKQGLLSRIMGKLRGVKQ